MSGRPRYKALYQMERAAFRHAADRADYFQKEVQRLKALLAEEGRNVLLDAEEFRFSTIRLRPLQYEMAVAFVEANARFSPGDNSMLHGASVYAWRGRPIVRAE